MNTNPRPMATFSVTGRSRSTWFTALVCLLLLLLVLTSCAEDTVLVAPPLAAPSGVSHRFLVLLCMASDATSMSPGVTYYQRMFTNNGPSLRNAYNYFIDESYGTINLEGTVVKDWLKTSVSTAALEAMKPADHPNYWRNFLAQACADAYASRVQFADFASGGIITVWNVDGLDSGATSDITEGGVKYPAINAAADARTTSFFTHEMLHLFGLQHAYGPYRSHPWDPKMQSALDLTDTHTFGSTTPIEYGDCWTIMGCGLWVGHDAEFGDTGPDLSATQRRYLGWWTAPDRVFTYDRSSTVTITLAPANVPSQPGTLLIDIPLGDIGHYTVEYIAKSGWSDAIPMEHAVLIHEVRAHYERQTVLVGRTPYGAWLKGQVFLDPVNHVRIQILSDDGPTAQVQLSPSGTSDGGAFSCIPPKYADNWGDGEDPSVNLLAPAADASVVAGLPITLSAMGVDPLLTVPRPEQFVWSANGTPIGTKSTLTYTFSTPGDVRLAVTMTGHVCSQATKQEIIHVVAAPTSTVSIVSPLNNQVFDVTPSGGWQLISVTLTGAGTPDIVSYTWADSTQGPLGTGQTITAILLLHPTGNCATEEHIITLTGKNRAGYSPTAQVTIVLKSANCIQ